jgi:hypothetical protein
VGSVHQFYETIIKFVNFYENKLIGQKGGGIYIIWFRVGGTVKSNKARASATYRSLAHLVAALIHDYV